MKISTVLGTMTTQLRSETDDLLTAKSDLLEVINEALNYSLDNYEVPFQKMADKIKESLDVTRNLVYLKSIHLKEYCSTYQTLIKSVFVPEFDEVERNILRIKESNITVDPNLMINADEMGFHMIKEIKAPQLDNGLIDQFIGIEVDESTVYSVPELTNNIGQRLNDLCHYFYQLFVNQVSVMLEKQKDYMKYLEEMGEVIDRIIEENSDPKEAQSKLSAIYTRLSDRHPEHTNDSYNFLLPYYTNLLMVSDNVRKTFDIYQKAHDLFVDPSHVKYGVL